MHYKKVIRQPFSIPNSSQTMCKLEWIRHTSLGEHFFHHKDLHGTQRTTSKFKPNHDTEWIPHLSMGEHPFLHKDLHALEEKHTYDGVQSMWWSQMQFTPTHYVSMAPFGKTETCRGSIFHAQNLLQGVGHPWYGNWGGQIGNNEAIRDDKSMENKKATV